MARSPTQSSRHRKSLQDPDRIAAVAPPSLPAGADRDASGLSFEQDELYRVPVDPVLEKRLREIQEAATRRPPPQGAMAPEPVVALEPGLQACALCADQMKPLGLPYRIVLRCTHQEIG